MRWTEFHVKLAFFCIVMTSLVVLVAFPGCNASEDSKATAENIAERDGVKIYRLYDGGSYKYYGVDKDGRGFGIGSR